MAVAAAICLYAAWRPTNPLRGAELRRRRKPSPHTQQRRMKPPRWGNPHTHRDRRCLLRNDRRRLRHCDDCCCFMPSGDDEVRLRRRCQRINHCRRYLLQCSRDGRRVYLTWLNRSVDESRRRMLSSDDRSLLRRRSRHISIGCRHLSRCSRGGRRVHLPRQNCRVVDSHRRMHGSDGRTPTSGGDDALFVVAATVRGAVVAADKPLRSQGLPTSGSSSSSTSSACCGSNTSIHGVVV